MEQFIHIGGLLWGIILGFLFLRNVERIFNIHVLLQITKENQISIDI